MFAAAAKSLAEQVLDDDLEQGRIYPSLSRLREVSVNIAVAVARVAFAAKLTARSEPADWRGFIESKMYNPSY